MAAGPVDAVVRLPGSKSVTNRALVLSALAEAPTLLRAPLRARDTLLMAAALRALGTGVTDRDGDWYVEPAPLHGPATVDCGLAGTVMRFVPPLAGLAEGPVRFDGDARARQRPMGAGLAALRAVGARVADEGRGALPFTVHGTGGLAGGRVVLDASASSQFVSGLLLVGPRCRDGVEVAHEGPPMPSQPHVDLTVAMLRAAGAVAERLGPHRWRVAPGPLRGGARTVEPDLSNAAPFLAAALVTGGRVRVPGWPAETAQPGAAVLGLLEAMGGRCTVAGGAVTVTGTGRIHGVDVDLHEVGELTPTVAALAALADAPSRLRGIGHLRGHETDRLAALAHEITALGGDVTETEDGLLVRPRPLHGGDFATYDDHRLVTTGALLGLAVPGVTVLDPGAVDKTLPAFPELWAELLGGAR